MDYIKQHRDNLLKSVGLTEINAGRYEYIVSYEQLNDWLIKQNNDLAYPLRKEVKRDRYILNGIGYERAMQETTKVIMDEITNGVIEWLKSDVIPMIEWEIVNLGSVNSSNRKSNTDWAYKLGSKVGKAIADTITHSVWGK